MGNGPFHTVFPAFDSSIDNDCGLAVGDFTVGDLLGANICLKSNIEKDLKNDIHLMTPLNFISDDHNAR